MCQSIFAPQKPLSDLLYVIAFARVVGVVRLVVAAFVHQEEEQLVLDDGAGREQRCSLVSGLRSWLLAMFSVPSAL